MKALVTTCRSVTSDQSNSLIDCMAILNEYHKSFDLLTPTKTNRSAEYVGQSISMGVNRAPVLDYSAILADKLDWEDVYNNIDISPFKTYDVFYIFGGLHFPQSNLTRFSKRAQKFPVSDKGQLKFLQFAHNVVNVMAVHKAHVEFDIPLHELSYDTDEFASHMLKVKQNPEKYNNYHSYGIDQYGMKRLDCVQYKHLFQSPMFEEANPKVYDLVFGYTLYNYGDRPKHVGWIESTAEKLEKKKIYCKNAIEKDKSFTVPKDQYIKELKRSLYTLIIPSYDPNCFSFYRFLEALQSDCCPILHPDCPTEDVKKNFGYCLEYLKDKTLPYSCETKRQTVLEELKSVFLTYRYGFDKS